MRTGIMLCRTGEIMWLKYTRSYENAIVGLIEKTSSVPIKIKNYPIGFINFSMTCLYVSPKLKFFVVNEYTVLTDGSYIFFGYYVWFVNPYKTRWWQLFFNSFYAHTDDNRFWSALKVYLDIIPHSFDPDNIR